MQADAAVVPLERQRAAITQLIELDRGVVQLENMYSGRRNPGQTVRISLVLYLRIVRMKGLIAAMVALLAACGGGPTLTPNPTEPATPVPSRDLAGIVVAPDAPPPGMSHNATKEGKPVMTRVVISGRASEFLALPGLVTGRYTEFSGESRMLLSLGLLFDTRENAELAFDLYLDELQSQEGYGFGTGVEAGLGDEGTCDEGDNPRLGGLHESICLWRNGDLVLISGGTLDADDLHSIAEGMDARAR